MTPGQELALQQTRRIEAERSGAISIVDTRIGDESLRISLSIDCRGLPHESGGIVLRERERIDVTVPATFPFRPPAARTAHKRWADVNHVQWSNYLCLFLAPETEWDPSDGMFGFLERLLKWITAASLGELDAVGGPIHPPAVYQTTGCPTIIPRVDTPAVTDQNWWGFAEMTVAGGHRRDIIGWCEIKEASTARDALDAVAPALLLSDPLPWEYPTSLISLLLALIKRGVATSMLFTMLRLGQLLHDDDYVYMVVGTPMRGTVGGDTVQHLAVWRFKATDVAAFYNTVAQDGDTAETDAERDAAFSELLDWAVKNNVQVEWCPVREARGEATLPRDGGSSMSEWAERRVAIWGCGALGGAVAEHLVRSGVRELVLRDNSTVAPGVLVRQNFEDADIGRSKATALAERLERIAPDVEVHPFTTDLTGDLAEGWYDDTDVVFDLTASPAVAQRLESYRMRHPSQATVIAMSISHDARHGLVVSSQPSATGGPVDMRRKAKITASRNPTLKHLAEEFWPTDPARTTGFAPEPGCSSPTFVGSNAEVAALASTMLLLASTAPVAHDMIAGFVTLPTLSEAGATRVFTFPNDVTLADPINNHQIRITPEAVAEMRAWARRSRRLNPRDETGGHLFGERDDALGVVWVNDIVGPPPDSFASPNLFVCGVDGVDAATTAIRSRSRDANRPIGMWHTHPDSLPVPSPTDHQGMTQIVTDTETATPKQLLVIVGGHPDRPLLGAFIYERHQDNTLPETRIPLTEIPPEPVRDHTIGLALSGGGFRAVAFHLGVLRALHDRGVLDRVEVISSVSGGSIIAAMWTYSFEDFNDFDARVTRLLQRGLNRRIATATLVTPRAARHAATFAAAAITSLGRTAQFPLRRIIRQDKTSRGPRIRRSLTITSSVERVLRAELGNATMDAPARDVHAVINACDLRTGTAFRFGSVESGSSKYGKLAFNNVPVSLAAAASAAYPAILPAIDSSFDFVDRSGNQTEQRVLLTDGGVYDNLGTTCLEPGRSKLHSTNVHPVDYIISADAGRGALDERAFPVWWPARMKRSFEAVYRKVQDGGKGVLFDHQRNGALKGIVMPFLGQRDDALPIQPTNLVRRGDVVGYPTNFSRMKAADIELLTARGEQLTRLMIEHHCPEIS